jgi:hypothetical protein
MKNWQAREVLIAHSIKLGVKTLSAEGLSLACIASAMAETWCAE